MLAREMLQKLADALLDHRIELVRELRVVEQDLATLDRPEVVDREERGQREERARMLNDLGETTRRSIAEIDRALDRVAQDRYGRCVRCGRDVAIERLEAMPAVELCLACARGLGVPGEARPAPPTAA